MNVYNLTDAQIRAKFIELGHPVGPVTATTRKIMVKKLKALIDSGAKPPTTSGEESDGGRLSTKSKRKTMPPPKSGTRSPRKKTSPGRSDSNMVPIASSTIIEPVGVSRRSLTSRDYHNMSYLDDSDDSSSPPIKYAPSNSPQLNKYTPLNAQKIGNEAFRASLNASTNNSMSPHYSSSSYSNSPSFDQVNTRSISTSQSDTSFPDAPFASEFLKRLSAGRSREILPSQSYPMSTGLSKKLLEVKESDDEDSVPSPNFSRFSQGRATRDSLNCKGYRRITSSDSWYLLDSPISALILVLFVLFFGAIGVVYINKTTVDTNLSSPIDIDYNLCSNLPAHLPDINCVKEEDRTYVELMLNIVLSELNDKISDAPCTTSSISLSDNDLLKLIKSKDKTLSFYGVEKNINNLKIIFEENPKWNIKPTKDGIDLLNLPQTVYCTSLSYVTIVADWVVKISIGVLILIGIYITARWWIQRENRHKEEVYKLVANIIEIVSSKALSPDSFVPISHVRDQLIPLKDREKMKRLWEDALKLLESDSRLRREVQEVEGEHFMVWRWLASNLTTNKKKVWQGQAFDTLEGNLNSHVESPTNCLKIRHMFEAGQEEGDDWVTTVIDAILEKCGSAKVLHLMVDRQSPEGLVYMKCATRTDAGMAYRSLHGSWFASNLITVKYIREHRYHERFPDSINAAKPLRPSNNYQRSLK